MVAMATSLSTFGLPSNTRIFGPIQAHILNGISHFSRFRIDDCRVSNGMPFSQIKIAPSHMGSGQHLIHGSRAHPSPQPKRHLDQFSRFCTDDRSVSLYFAMERHFLHWKFPLPTGNLDPHLIHGSLGSAESSTQKASWSVQPFLQGWLVWVWQTDGQTNRPTDRPCYSVDNSRQHLRRLHT